MNGGGAVFKEGVRLSSELFRIGVGRVIGQWSFDFARVGAAECGVQVTVAACKECCSKVRDKTMVLCDA